MSSLNLHVLGSRLISSRSVPHNDSWHAILHSIKNKNNLSGKHNSIHKETCSRNLKYTIFYIIPGHFHREISILIRRLRAIHRLKAPEITHTTLLPDPAFRTNIATSALMTLLLKETPTPGGSGYLVETDCEKYHKHWKIIIIFIIIQIC